MSPKIIIQIYHCTAFLFTGILYEAATVNCVFILCGGSSTRTRSIYNRHRSVLGAYFFAPYLDFGIRIVALYFNDSRTTAAAAELHFCDGACLVAYSLHSTRNCFPFYKNISYEVVK